MDVLPLAIINLLLNCLPSFKASHRLPCPLACSALRQSPKQATIRKSLVIECISNHSSYCMAPTVFYRVVPFFLQKTKEVPKTETRSTAQRTGAAVFDANPTQFIPSWVPV
jgi:hypothetical protein